MGKERRGGRHVHMPMVPNLQYTWLRWQINLLATKSSSTGYRGYKRVGL